MWAHQQILDHVGLGALEARARRNLGHKDALLVDTQLRVLLAPARLLAPFLGLASFGRLLLHAARLDLGPPLEPFQPRDLLAQPGVLRPKTRVLFKKPQNQLLEVPKTKTINIWGRPGHSRIESQNPPIWESPNSKKIARAFAPVTAWVYGSMK